MVAVVLRYVGAVAVLVAKLLLPMIKGCPSVAAALGTSTSATATAASAAQRAVFRCRICLLLRSSLVTNEARHRPPRNASGGALTPPHLCRTNAATSASRAGDRRRSALERAASEALW